MYVALFFLLWIAFGYIYVNHITDDKDEEEQHEECPYE